MSSERPKRRLRNFLLDTRYQVTFSLPLVLVVAALFAGLGYLASEKTEAATKIGLHHLELAGASMGSDAEALRETLLARERNIKRGIVAGGLVLCAGLLLFGVALTHRVAGPLYRVRAVLGRIGDGVHEPVPDLRKHDLLVDFFATLKLACAALRERDERELELLRRVIALAERDPALRSEQLEGLRRRAEQKERALV